MDTTEQTSKTTTKEGNMIVNEYSWHVKKVGDKIYYICGCSIRAGVRHRRTIDGAGYEKIIKVAFGQDTTIEPIAS